MFGVVVVGMCGVVCGDMVAVDVVDITICAGYGVVGVGSAVGGTMGYAVIITGVGVCVMVVVRGDVHVGILLCCCDCRCGCWWWCRYA